MRQLPGARRHGHLVLRVRAREANTPTGTVARLSEEPDVVDSRQARVFSNPPFRRLHRKRVAAPAAIRLEPELAGQVVVEQRPGVTGGDSAEVEALGKADEVAGKPVAADVADLPDPVVVEPI